MSFFKVAVSMNRLQCVLLSCHYYNNIDCVDVEVVILTIQAVNRHSLVVCLVVTVPFLMTSRMLCALRSVPTILARPRVLQYVTFVSTL